MACRICLQPDKEVNLVSPCKCTGSSKYVHQKCIREWQNTVLKSILANPEKPKSPQLFNCTVCKSPLELSFAQDSAKWITLSGSVWLLLRKSKKLLTAIIGFFLLLNLFRYNFLALAFAGLSLSAGFFRLRQKELRVSVSRNRTGWRVELIRCSFENYGLKPGKLIKSTSKIHKGIFYKSIVMITEYSQGGYTKGVIINKALEVPGKNAKIRIGGPVEPNTATVIGNEDGEARITDGVYLHGDAGKTHVRYQGFALWKPRQLEGEIKNENWKVLRKVKPYDLGF